MPIHSFPLVILLAAMALSARSEPTIELTAKLVKPGSPQYETISFVSEGVAYGHTDGAIRGRYHRVLVLKAGLAYDRPTLRLETLTYGDEACCRRVVRAWELDLEELQDKGLALPEAATTELRFLRWKTPRAIEFAYGELRCRSSDIGKDRIAVACTK